MADAVHLDLGHDREVAVAWHPGGGLELSDRGEALELTAELPPIPAADRALDEIRTGKVTGLSVEFQAVKEARVGGVRVIEEALLTGIGIVARPSMRARGSRRGRASMGGSQSGFDRTGTSGTDLYGCGEAHRNRARARGVEHQHDRD